MPSARVGAHSAINIASRITTYFFVIHKFYLNVQVDLQVS